MTHLQSFTWNLDTKPTKSMYQGLAARSSLTSLDLRFPTTRSPRPITIIPPIPTLHRLRVSDLDPLCYPDDLSLLVLHAKKLEDLRIHWSPRMRQEAEPSISLRSIFGKCLEAGYKVRIKHLGLQNFYGPNTGDFQAIFDPDSTESTDFIEVFGGSYSRPTTIWVDETWKRIPNAEYFKNFKRMRISETAPQHAKILTLFTGLEDMYFLSGSEMTRNLDTTLPTSPGTAATTPATSVSTPSSGTMYEKETITLCKQYLHALTTYHGTSLRRLLLSDQWQISGSQISELTSSCPNLEQLGLAIAKDASDALNLLAPFFTKLRAVRILKNEHSDLMLEDPDMSTLIAGTRIEPLFWKSAVAAMKWVSIGDYVFKIHKAVNIPDEDGHMTWQRQVTVASIDDVREIEIWRLDAHEL